jgi:hypothetical protein
MRRAAVVQQQPAPGFAMRFLPKAPKLPARRAGLAGAFPIS